MKRFHVLEGPYCNRQAVRSGVKNLMPVFSDRMELGALNACIPGALAVDGGITKDRRVLGTLKKLNKIGPVTHVTGHLVIDVRARAREALIWESPVTCVTR